MSEILVDSLTGKTSAGNITVTSEGGAATMQLQQGLAKAWVNFNGTGTVAIRDNLNVSSITDNATGQYTINLTSAMADGNGSYVFGCLTNSGGGDVRGENNVPPTTTTIHIYGLNGSQSALQDLDYIWMQAQGDLA